LIIDYFFISIDGPITVGPLSPVAFTPLMPIVFQPFLSIFFSMGPGIFSIGLQHLMPIFLISDFSLIFFSF